MGLKYFSLVLSTYSKALERLNHPKLMILSVSKHFWKCYEHFSTDSFRTLPIRLSNTCREYPETNHSINCKQYLRRRLSTYRDVVQIDPCIFLYATVQQMLLSVYQFSSLL